MFDRTLARISKCHPVAPASVCRPVDVTKSAIARNSREMTAIRKNFKMFSLPVMQSMFFSFLEILIP